MLYNEKMKVGYCEYWKLNSNRYAEDIGEILLYFEGIGVVERKFSKDASAFDPEQIVYLCNHLSNRGFKERLYKITSILKEYAAWVASNKMLPQIENYYEGLHKRDVLIPPIIPGERQIIGKNRMRQILDLFPSPRDRFFLLGQFEGIRGTMYTELLLAKIEHINFEKLTMDIYRFKDSNGTEIEYDRTIRISEELALTAKEANGVEFYHKGLKGDKILKWNHEMEQTFNLYKNRGVNFMTSKLKDVRKSHIFLLGEKGLDLVASGALYKIRVLAADEGVTLSEVIYLDEYMEILKDYNYSLEKRGYNFRRRVGLE